MTDPTFSAHTWLIDLRHVAVKKCHQIASDNTIILFAASKNKYRKAQRFAQQRAHVWVIKVSGNKTSRVIQQHIAHYLTQTTAHTITLVSRANKLTKRWQQWQTQLPHLPLLWAKKLPASHTPSLVVEPTAVLTNNTSDTVAPPIITNVATDTTTADHTLLMTAQAVIKKNKPKKKQDLARLLAQILHITQQHAHDVIKQLVNLGRLHIDVAENIKYH